VKVKKVVAIFVVIVYWLRSSTRPDGSCGIRKEYAQTSSTLLIQTTADIAKMKNQAK
jgi:hypothetical protein